MVKRNLTCTRHTLRPGSRDAVREWAEHAEAHREEYRQTLREEGVRLEMVLLEESEEGDSLIFILDTDDYDRAVEIFLKSQHDIDRYHLDFLNRNSLSRKRLKVLQCVEI